MKVLLEERRLSQAEQVARQVTALKPASTVMAEVALDLAMAMLRSCKPSEAESKAAMDRALTPASDRPDLYRRAAGLAIAKGKSEDAAKILAQAPPDRTVPLI